MTMAVPRRLAFSAVRMVPGPPWITTTTTAAVIHTRQQCGARTRAVVQLADLALELRAEFDFAAKLLDGAVIDEHKVRVVKIERCERLGVIGIESGAVAVHLRELVAVRQHAVAGCSGERHCPPRPAHRCR